MFPSGVLVLPLRLKRKLYLRSILYSQAKLETLTHKLLLWTVQLFV